MSTIKSFNVPSIDLNACVKYVLSLMTKYEKDEDIIRYNIMYYVHVVLCFIMTMLFYFEYYVLYVHYSLESVFRKIDTSKINRWNFKKKLNKAINSNDICVIMQLLKFKKNANYCDEYGEYNIIAEKIHRITIYNEACGMFCMELFLQSVPMLCKKAELIEMSKKFKPTYITTTLRREYTKMIFRHMYNEISYDLYSSMLMNIIMHDSDDIIRLMITKYNKHINCVVDNHGQTLLHKMCILKKTMMVIFILKHNKDNINTKDIVGYTPLFYASLVGSIKMVKVLLKNGCNVE